MKKLTKTTLAASILLLSGAASANDMYIDVGSNTYDFNDASAFPTLQALDADSTTGTFSEFGFSQILATSIYDMTDGTPQGSFYDTNITSELNFAGVPTSGTALDGSTTVNLTMPICGAQCDIDALSPLTPPIFGNDGEGFGLTWDLQLEYHFDGILTAGGPVYTGGFFDVFFNDIANDANDRQVLGGTLTGSQLQAANLNLFFDITMAEAGWLFMEAIPDGGIFVDVADYVAAGDAGGSYANLTLDTNVNPPIPTSDQLLLVVDDAGTPNAIRQTTLDGSVTAAVPEPSTIAMMGLGLLGLGAAARRRTKN